jgi:hypothetical protein
MRGFDCVRVFVNSYTVILISISAGFSSYVYSLENIYIALFRCLYSNYAIVILPNQTVSLKCTHVIYVMPSYSHRAIIDFNVITVCINPKEGSISYHQNGIM